MNFRHRRFPQSMIVFATTLVFVLSLLFPQISYSVSVQSTRLPHPFQFTENKGQWDSAVLYKCEVRSDGFTWFLERDGVTLVTSIIDSSSLVGAVREPPVSVNDARFDPNGRIHHSRLKSHALKLKFVDSRRGESQSARRRQSHSPLSDQDAQTNLGASAPTGRMRFAPTEKYSTQEDVGINSDLLFAQAKWIDAQGEFSWHNNYFLGNDSSKWAPDCRNFSRVVYHDVWDGIDVEWYESKGHLEFDFVVHPGADPKQIKMVCEGLEAPIAGGGRTLLSVDSDISVTKGSRTGVSDLRLSNELSLLTSLGELRMIIPGAYQTTANGSHGNAVTAQFRLVSENLFAIDLPNGYDQSQTLRIDPLVYSTYLGGSGVEGLTSATIDISGNPILTGSTNSINYPTTPGTIERMNAGEYDCFISRLDSTLSHLLFSTYLGGTFGDYGEEITFDSQNFIYVTGSTESDNFPTTSNAYCQTHSGFRTDDCFVLKVNSTGSQLLFSSMIGTSAQEVSNAIIVDESDSSCIITGSTGGITYPITAGAYTPPFNVGAVITKFDMFLPTLLFSTYIGGTNGAEGNCITKLPLDQSIIIGGYTFSSNYPCSIDAYDTTFNGAVDAFISRLSHDGSNLLKSTYLGGTVWDGIHHLAVSQDSLIIAVGYTSSSDFPYSRNAFDSTQHGGYDCFVTIINNNLSTISYSSLYGGPSNDVAVIVQSNNSGFIDVAGYTASGNFPTSANAFQRTFNGGANDCFVMRFALQTPASFYSTFLGGSGGEAAYGIAELTRNRLFVFGSTSSTNFPMTTLGYDTAHNGAGDCFIAQFTIDSTSVQESSPLPNSTLLVKNYPNPFNATTTLSYTLLTSSRVDLRLYDITGREVSTLVQREQRAGSYRVLLDGSRLASGTYFVRLQAGSFSKTQKIVLLK